MIKHYFISAWRNLAKQKVPALINVTGLTLGIGCFLLFLLFTLNELNYDRFHDNASNIFRVYEWHEPTNGNDPFISTGLPMPVGPAMKKDLPEIITSVRVQKSFRDNLVRIQNDIRHLNVYYADPSFFTVFSFPFLFGNSSTALKESQNIVLTRSRALALFGRENAIGSTLQIKTGEHYENFLVTGIVTDVPANSSLQFGAVANYHLLESSPSGQQMSMDWNTWSSTQVFVVVQPASILTKDPRKLSFFRAKYYPDEAKQLKDAGFTWKGNGPPVSYRLQPLLSMHIDPVVKDENSADIKTIWILLGIAGGLLLIACINFTTLAIGRSASRSKEVGLRKVIGARKKQVIFQFLSEALLLSFLSTIAGLLLAKFLLPFFNQLSGRELKFSFALFPELWWMLFALSLLVGLIAGSYPALILSNFKPIEVLRSKIRVGGSNLFTKSLVTLQFAVSMVLILATIIILQQIHHMNSVYLGFNKENLVLVDASETDANKIYPLFKQELSKHPEILAIANSNKGLGAGEDFDMDVFTYRDKKIGAMFNSIDPDYISTLGMQLMRGRDFSPLKPEDTVNSVIINEALMNKIGWDIDHAVGQPLTGFLGNKTPVVIGVVKNFNFMPLNEKIIPQLFCHFENKYYRAFFVRIPPGNPSASLATIEKTWNKLVSDVPFKYSFLDDKIDAYYKAEHRWGSIIGWAGGISIFLACLGLFGLASLTAVNRTKEIGIRKVMGAGMQDIVLVLSKNYLLMVSVSILMAAPISWWLMNKWLDKFAYRIQISGWIFLIVGMVSVLLAFATVAYQSVKAAIANPIESLRSE